MSFPFMFRSDHDEIVGELRARIIGLAKLLYPTGVPQEFQLLLGVSIPDSPSMVTAAVEEVEPTLTPIQKAEEEEAERQRDLRAELTSRMRTRPSTVGPALERIMYAEPIYAARAAHPAVARLFTEAKAEALKAN